MLSFHKFLKYSVRAIETTVNTPREWAFSASEYPGIFLLSMNAAFVILLFDDASFILPKSSRYLQLPLLFDISYEYIDFSIDERNINCRLPSETVLSEIEKFSIIEQKLIYQKNTRCT